MTVARADSANARFAPRPKLDPRWVKLLWPLLARWLATQPELIILDEPTRGIDIGAKAEIEQIVAKLRADGVAVVFISSEIEEVVRNSSRVIVLRERRKAAEFAGGEISTPRLMQAMAGGHVHHG